MIIFINFKDFWWIYYLQYTIIIINYILEKISITISWIKIYLKEFPVVFLNNIFLGSKLLLLPKNNTTCNATGILDNKVYHKWTKLYTAYFISVCTDKILLHTSACTMYNFSMQYDLKIWNKYFKHEDIHKYTLAQSTWQLKSINDYIIKRQECRINLKTQELIEEWNVVLTILWWNQEFTFHIEELITIIMLNKKWELNLQYQSTSWTSCVICL